MPDTRYTYGMGWPGGDALVIGDGPHQVLSTNGTGAGNNTHAVVTGIATEWQAKLIAAVFNGIEEPH